MHKKKWNTLSISLKEEGQGQATQGKPSNLMHI
jgi:hypothetical protein